MTTPGGDVGQPKPKTEAIASGGTVVELDRKPTLDELTDRLMSDEKLDFVTASNKAAKILGFGRKGR